MANQETNNASFYIPDDETDILDSTSKTGISLNRGNHLEPDPYTCYQFEHEDFENIANVDYWLNGIIGFPIAAGGLVNNIIFTCILCRASLRNTLFNQLLIAFSVINTCSLIGRMIHIFDKTFHVRTGSYVYLFPHFLYPLRSILLAADVFMTVALVHERWRVVSQPNHRSGPRHKLAIYIGLVLLLSVGINIPRFFEMTKVPTTLGHYFLKPTSLRTNSYYSIFYICWARLLLLKILPNVLLALFCYKMYQAIKFAPSETSSGQTSSDFNMDHERRLASIFLSIVAAFFVCHIPANFLNIHEAATINRLIYCLERKSNGLPPWILTLHDVSNFFLYAYPCINLLFIFVPRHGYRDHYLSFILCRVFPTKSKTRFDGEDPIEDEQEIMDHELSDFHLSRTRNSF